MLYSILDSLPETENVLSGDRRADFVEFLHFIPPV